MDKFQRSWELFKSSLTVMTTNRTLLVFPVLTAVLSVVLILLFLAPVAFQNTGYGYGSSEHWQAVGNSVYDVSALKHQNSGVQSGSTGDASPGYRTNNKLLLLQGVKPLALGYFIIIYFSTMFLATFLNVAFYREIMNALRGEPASITDGLAFACSKWKSILMWTLLPGSWALSSKPSSSGSA